MTPQPRIHLAIVTDVRQLGPGMIRVGLGGPDLADYPTTGVGDEYVRVFFPDAPGERVRMPFVTERGWDFPAGVEPAEMRTYTIRAHRPGRIEIDFVVHPGGIAAEWALAARPGAEIALNQPTELYARPERASAQVLIADEPALPAALRIAELTAAELPTRIICEIRAAGHELTAELPAGVAVDYTWLRGSGNGVRPSQLPEVLDRLALPDDGSTYVWVAGETRVTRSVRRHLRHGLGLPAASYRVVGYWTDRAEEWSAGYAALEPAVRDRIDALYASDLDVDVMIDEVDQILSGAGL